MDKGLRKLLRWVRLSPCSPAHLPVHLSLLFNSQLPPPFPTNLIFCDKPAGLKQCLEIPCNLILQKEHKSGSVIGLSLDLSSEALGKL